MSRTITNDSTIDVGFASAAGLLAYSLLAYSIGVAGLMLLILATLGLMPLGMFPIAEQPLQATLVDLGLLSLFGVQHSVMARASFKRWLSRILPAALERSTYVWTSGAAMAAIVLLWQPLNGIVWQTGGTLHGILLACTAFGWAYTFAATYAINHWDLFGLRQAWLAARNQPYTPVGFTERWMYRYSRHPIQAGVLMGIWPLATMTASQLLLSVGLTAYIAIGLFFEERDLIRQWGQNYLDYKRRVGAFLSRPGA